jgi:hypothetical protein
VIDQINRVVRAARELFVQTGRQPTAEEGRQVGMTPEKGQGAAGRARKPVTLTPEPRRTGGHP